MAAGQAIGSQQGPRDRHAVGAQKEAATRAMARKADAGRDWASRLFWFVALWGAGVTAVALVAFGIRGLLL